MRKGSQRRVPAVETGLSGDPEQASPVLKQREDAVVAQAVGIGRVMAVDDESLFRRKPAVQALIGADPERALAVEE